MIGRPRRRPSVVPTTVRAGERVLGWADDPSGEPVVAATLEALHVRVERPRDEQVSFEQDSPEQVSPEQESPELGGLAWRRLDWHRVHSVAWAADEELLTVREAGRAGARASVVLRLSPDQRSLGGLLELARERIAATVVVQRWVQVPGGTVGVVGRRALARPGPQEAATEPGVLWALEVPAGVDPRSASVRELLAAALRDAREEIGGPG